MRIATLTEPHLQIKFIEMPTTFTEKMANSTARSSSSLRQFQLEGVQDTGRTVGDGGYATVKELEYRGLKCVGKKLHGLLYDLARPQEKAAMLERFAGECELLSRLHHPCIVQFLGVLLERGSQLPVLVMEYLNTNLSSCLDRYGVLPEEIGYGILRDVALGLRYLHESTPPIIHRDLSANNVLLTTSMNAKISDLGVAKIINLSPAQITQRITTQAPGTPCYMPPEALISKPSYTSKIDSYSFGVLIIHVLCGRWPFPADVFQADPRNPGSFVPISEVERRAEYLQEIDQDNPLLALIRQCLSNAPASRPEATEILHQIRAVLSQLPATFENRLEMAQRIKSQRAEIEPLRTENASLRVEIGSQSVEIEQRSAQSQREVQLLRAQVERLSIQDSVQNTQPPTEHEPHLLTPQAKLQWTRCADLPVVKMTKPQSVVIGGRVYVGGGNTASDDDRFSVFQYTPERNEWVTLPPHTVGYFGMGQFQGDLITVGGADKRGSITGKVYRFNKQSHKWEKFLKPMPTARLLLSLITTQSAIIACGGVTGKNSDGKLITRSTVEVYTTSTSQWSTTDPLPITCGAMTSVTIADTCYLIGGKNVNPIKTVLYAPISSLVQRARSQQAAGSSHPDSVWKTLPDTPLAYSAAASLGGCLLAVGGWNDQQNTLSAVHIFIPLTNSWVRVNPGDLPELRDGCNAIQLPDNKLIVIGGNDNENKTTNTVFMGSITI